MNDWKAKSANWAAHRMRRFVVRVRRVARSVPRSRLFLAMGASVALLAPMGLAVVRALASARAPTLSLVLDDIASSLPTYGYVAAWTAAVTALPGYVLGRRLDGARALSLTDPLTGLSNRRHFGQRLADTMSTSRRTGAPAFVLCLDLDRLKTINDTFGHHAGDDAIVAVADAISESVRANDVVARLGGDEFAVVLPGTNHAEALAISERILANVSACGGRAFPLTISIGVAQIVPATTARDALNRADTALYGAKAAGGDRISCTTFGAQRATDRMDIAAPR